MWRALGVTEEVGLEFIAFAVPLIFAAMVGRSLLWCVRFDLWRSRCASWNFVRSLPFGSLVCFTYWFLCNLSDALDLATVKLVYFVKEASCHQAGGVNNCLVGIMRPAKDHADWNGLDPLLRVQEWDFYSRLDLGLEGQFSVYSISGSHCSRNDWQVQVCSSW